LLAISRCFSGDIDANPRLALGFSFTNHLWLLKLLPHEQGKRRTSQAG